ncbi:MAG TPA: hypothetical protein VFR02_10200, partial [bacterium]|nr:hypothetical protein [bacterium]
MKRMKLWLAGGLLASLAVYPLAALADDGAGAPPPDDGAMQGPPPEGMGEMGGGKWLDTMKDKLGLSDSQVGQIKKNLEDQKNALKPIREDIRTQTKVLAEKVKAGAKDQDLKP